jgi:glycosyl transferase family WbsX
MSMDLRSTPAASAEAPPPAVRAIAYYLPQYYPIPENDAWWGKGFTEWTNVCRAKPLFEGHYQPHLPTELGYYDLRLPEVRARQADLAREYGIHGFCYYYYSFGGKRLLERPLQDMLESGTPDFPFCICWANETWSRRWDGAEAQILIAQDDSEEFYRGFIGEVLPILQDPRYIRVDGKPVVLIYRVGRIPNSRGVAQAWREAASAAGLPGLYLCAVQSHDPSIDPRSHGFDAAVEFPPSPWHGGNIDAKKLKGLDPDFNGRLFDYREFVTAALSREAPSYRLLRGVMTDWDNTARRGPAAYVFRNASPRAYEAWLRASVAWTSEHTPPDERIVFVNAWNEWAEGAHLEPDARHGRAWLEATRRALSPDHGWRVALDAIRCSDRLSPEAIRLYADDLEHALLRSERAEQPGRATRATLTAAIPQSVDGKPVSSQGIMKLDELQGDAPRGRSWIRRGEPIHLTGWAIAPGVEVARTTAFVMLRSPNGERIFMAPIDRRMPRHDVAFKHRAIDGRSIGDAGFDLELDTEALQQGEYELAVLHASEERVIAALSEHRLVVE